MAKLLKLTGVATYTITGASAPVKKGDVCKFTDAQAKRIRKKGRYNAESEFVSYFTAAPEGAQIKHDFTVLDTGPVEPAKPRTNVVYEDPDDDDNDEEGSEASEASGEDGDDAQDAPPPPKAKSAPRKRPARAAA